MESDEKKLKKIEIDYKKMEEGTCRIQLSPTGERWAICKEEGKIKIFPVKDEERSREAAVEEAKRLLTQKEMQRREQAVKEQGASPSILNEQDAAFEVSYSFNLSKDRVGFVKMLKILAQKPQTEQQLRRADFEDPMLIRHYLEKYDSVLFECVGTAKLCSTTDLGKRVLQEIKH